MKKLLILLIIALLAMNFAACSDDDDDNGGTNPTEPQDKIVGTWVSEGDNVAPLLVSIFKIVKVTATFNDNGTYEVVQVDSSNTQLTLTGTYSSEESDVDGIYTIALDQQSPSTLTSEGIYEINTDVDPWEMKYEVVQTSPDIGATPPTPEMGFGSSSGGALGMTNVQTYVKQ
jgi:hypothetical protein